MNSEHYFVFELRRAAEATVAETPFALFKMRWEDNGPVVALVITRSPDGERAEVRDLRRPAAAAYTVPLSGGSGRAGKPEE